MQAASSHNWTALEHDDSKELLGVVTFQAVLNSRVAETRHSLPGTIDLMTAFDADDAVPECRPTEEVDSN